MPEGHYDRKVWSHEDIERYLTGQMSDAELHALERAALDDPFLSDAIEGLRQRTPVERSADMSVLSKRLEERTDEKVKRMGAPSRWWWAAAALLILAGGTWFWQAGLDIDEPKIAEVIKRDTSVSHPDTTIARMQKGKPEHAPLTLTDTRHPITDNPKPIPDNRHLTPETKADDLSTARSEAPPAAAIQAPRPVVAEAKASMHLYRGRVVDDKGQGVPFTNIAMSGGGAPNYSDAKGEFKIMTMDSSITLSAHAVGFNDARATLKYNQPEVLIMLTPSLNAFSEVVVTGLGSKKGRANASKVEASKIANADAEDEEESEPLDGWAKYEHYLNNNVRHSALGDELPAPEVEISFLVSPSGTPFDLKVERSSCSTCEQEARRLLRDGPKWESGKSTKKPLKGYITMHF